MSIETRELGDGRSTLTIDWSNVDKVDWPARCREFAAAGVYFPSANMIEDNQRRVAAGLPMTRRGTWK